jgi:hypothetical protein
MRLYGSQSRISKSATRHARAHRPMSGFASLPQAPRRQSSTLSAGHSRRTQEQPEVTVLIPRSV